MYSPQVYAAVDAIDLVRRYPFATLTTLAGGRIHATSLPLYFESDDTSTMVGHLARINPQAEAMQPAQPFLAIFTGPNAYVSASWFRARLTVPTWNYVAAQVRGTLDPIDEDEEQIRILRHTAALAEAGVPNPWTLEQAPPGCVALLLPRIRSFRLKIEAIEGIEKLSQIHPPSDIPLIMRQLLLRGDSQSVEVARLMTRLIE